MVFDVLLLRVDGAQKSALVSKFSKVRDEVIYCSELSNELTFENVVSGV